MDEIVSYSKQYNYDTLKIGITVPVKLTLSDETVVFEAKIDTGAENCIFERIHGERLGLIIESGEKQIFSTAAGNFVGYAHEVGLSVLEIEFSPEFILPNHRVLPAAFLEDSAGSTG